MLKQTYSTFQFVRQHKRRQHGRQECLQDLNHLQFTDVGFGELPQKAFRRTKQNLTLADKMITRSTESQIARRAVRQWVKHTETVSAQKSITRIQKGTWNLHLRLNLKDEKQDIGEIWLTGLTNK